MIRDFNAYARLLQALLPRGRAWRADDPVRTQLLTGKAVELARVDTRMDDLLREADVRTAVELLAEYETEFGLTPAAGATTADRQAALLGALRSLGHLNKPYYIGLASALGYTVHIDEFRPFWCGLGVCGDPVGDQTNLFYWLVNVHYDFVNPFSSYDDLVALVNKLKPVHTVALFTLYGPGFDNGFSSGFLAMPAADLTTGAFDKGFDKGFSVFFGGGFDGAGFADGFDKPFVQFGY